MQKILRVWTIDWKKFLKLNFTKVCQKFANKFTANRLPLIAKKCLGDKVVVYNYRKNIFI